MYLDLAMGEKIDSKKILERFHYNCFKCGKDLSNCQSEKERPIDHTLPIFYLWPYTTKNATLLCQDHNGKKQGLWPSDFYEDAKLKELSIITGLNCKLISGPPVYYPEAIKKLQDPAIVDNLLKKNSRYFDEIVTLRNRIKNDVGLDFFEYSTILSADHKKRANDRFDETYGKRLIRQKKIKWS